MQRNDSMMVDVKMNEQVNQVHSFRTQTNVARMPQFYPQNTSSSQLLNAEMNTSGADLNQMNVNPATILMNNSKILRNAKPATQTDALTQRYYNQGPFVKSFDNSVGNGPCLPEGKPFT